MGEEKINILLIGNGFDLAHGLPTKYSDFLEFIKIISDILLYEKDKIDYTRHPKLEKIIENERNDSYNNIHSKRYEWELLIKNNFWIDYFRDNIMYKKENWIDFENEIRNVIKTIHNKIREYGCQDQDQIKKMGIPLLDDRFLVDYDRNYQDMYEKAYSIVAEKGLSIKEETEFIKEYINKCGISKPMENMTYAQLENRLMEDLNRLIRALELYLTRYVAQIPVIQKLPDIDELSFEFILTFNYTDTYLKNYGKDNKIINYIHGKAEEVNDIESNNMVLGIDEYLESDMRSEDIRFVDFTKYYQRIYKQTGNEYRYWIEAINRDPRPKVTEQCISNDGRPAVQIVPKYNLYIIGHSLDVTDKDILREFLLNDKIRTTIFYYCKDQRANQIRNLVKLIGPQELIRRTGGREQTIFFRQQRAAIDKKEI